MDLTEKFVKEMEAIEARINLKTQQIHVEAVARGSEAQFDAGSHAYAQVMAEVNVEHRVRMMLALEEICIHLDQIARGVYR